MYAQVTTPLQQEEPDTTILFLIEYVCVFVLIIGFVLTKTITLFFGVGFIFTYLTIQVIPDIFETNPV